MKIIGFSLEELDNLIPYEVDIYSKAIATIKNKKVSNQND